MARRTEIGAEMKILTPEQIGDVLADVVADREKQAELSGQPFNGISQADALVELSRRIGTDWVVKKERSFKLTKQDLNAVANNRFYRKTGVKLLMVLIIVILALAMLTITFRIIPVPAYWGLCSITALAFIYWYSRKQNQARRELWKEFEGHQSDKG